MNGYRMMRVGGVVVLAFAAVVLFQASQRSCAAPSISARDLVGIEGGVNCKCKTTSSCSTIKHVYYTDNTCVYCNGSSTDGWCKNSNNKNCSTSGTFACGTKYKCEDVDCTIMCGSQGDCSFGKATSDSDGC